MVDSPKCCFCSEEETQSHLLFDCVGTKGIWMKVLAWLQIQHIPSGWTQEMKWIIQKTKGKGARAKILKLATTESIYEIWRYMNDKCFGNNVFAQKTYDTIIDTIVYRGWKNKKLRPYVAKLML
ncbi:unnamed protein product [Lathyrus oleraceus]